MEKITFLASDGLEITADLYQNENIEAPMIVLCHQTGFSRGEYLETAPKLLSLGYSCLALDQRSGLSVNNVANETAERAKAQGLGHEYVDALPDLEGAFEYVYNEHPKSRMMWMGSSYSASLTVIMAARYGDNIQAAVSFSPGEYFTFEGSKIENWASQVDIPIFITSAKNEVEDWRIIYDKLPSPFKFGIIPEGEGTHGSRNLWSSTPNHSEYWDALINFLDDYFPVEV